MRKVFQPFATSQSQPNVDRSTKVDVSLALLRGTSNFPVTHSHSNLKAEPSGNDKAKRKVNVY